MKTRHTIEIEVEWPVSEAAIYAGVTINGNEPEGMLWSLEGLRLNFGIERPFVPAPTQVTWIDRREHEIPPDTHILVGGADVGEDAMVWIGYYHDPRRCGGSHWAPLPELPQVQP
jgi:hypothetical protein